MTLRPSSLLVALVMSGGCKGCDDRILAEPPPEDAAKRFAQAVCAAEVECGCGLHASEAECRTEVESAFEAITDMGIDFDEECFDAFLVSQIFTGCSEGGAGAPSCEGKAMVGHGEVGDPCVRWNMFTMLPGQTCKDGLDCDFDGVCRAPPDLSEGASHAAGDSCNPDFPSCGGILYCVNESSTCAARTPIGGVCVQYDQCESGAYCKGLSSDAGICAALVELGQPCSPEDVKPCEDGWCDATAEVCQEPTPFVCLNQATRLVD